MIDPKELNKTNSRPVVIETDSHRRTGIAASDKIELPAGTTQL